MPANTAAHHVTTSYSAHQVLALEFNDEEILYLCHKCVTIAHRHGKDKLTARAGDIGNTFKNVVLNAAITLTISVTVLAEEVLGHPEERSARHAEIVTAGITDDRHVNQREIDIVTITVRHLQPLRGVSGFDKMN